MKFNASPNRSVGVEWELLLIDPVSYDLKNDILRLIEVAPDHKNLKPEFIQNTIEIVSDPGDSLPAVQANVADTLSELMGIAEISISGWPDSALTHSAPTWVF